MPRPKKHKKLGHMPRKCSFGPKDNLSDTAYVLSLEQFETIRLIDQLKYQQSEAAETMNVARTTVQKLYKEARNIIANALVEGAYIYIKGEPTMKESCCQKEKHHATKLLIPVNKNVVAIDHQTAERFALYTLENNTVVRKDTIIPDEQGCCRKFIQSLGVEHLITGSMKSHHFKRYQETQIAVYYGRDLSLEDALKSFLEGTLKSIEPYLSLDDDAACCHDHDHDHEEGCCGEEHHEESHEEGCCGKHHHSH